MLLISCGEDNKTNIAPTDPLESAYFEDYEPPFKKWGFINTKGEEVIKDKYDDLRDFNFGLAAANHNGKWGFINTKGKLVIPHTFRSVKNFNGSFILVQDFSLHWSCITQKGNTIVNLGKITIGNHNKSYVSFENNNRSKLYHVKKDSLVSGTFEKIKFNHDKIIVKVNGHWHFFDVKNGKPQSPSFQNIYLSNSDLYRAKTLEGNQVFVNDKAEKEIKEDFINATDFNKDYAYVETIEYAGIINKMGAVISKLEFGPLISAKDGFWKYYDGEGWIIMDSQGVPISTTKFKYLHSFSDGLIAFGMDDKSWGYLNKDAEMVIPAILPIVWDFKEGRARYIERSGMGMINKNFELAIPAKFNDIRDFQGGFARFQSL